jgi:type II secretory pathway pseudopilin PulG
MTNMKSRHENMNMYRKNQFAGLKYQKGMTLIELLVAGVISLIASSAMVILMASTLGTGTRTIMVTKLGDEMRTSMQIMTRELRRANYHSTFAACFGNPDCATTVVIDDYINSVSEAGKGIGIDDTPWSTNDCLWFWYDRDSDKTTLLGTAAEPVAAFRRAEDGDGIGIIQMTTAEHEFSTAVCDVAREDTKWVDVTDPNLVDVTTLEIDNNIATSADYDTSFLYAFLDLDTVNSYPYTLGGSSQAVERVGITMTGSLVGNVTPDFMQGADAPTVVLQDFIRIRNNTIKSTP